MSRIHTKRRTRRLKRGLGIAATSAVIIGTGVAGISAAHADTHTVTEDSAAHGHFLSLEGLGLNVADAAYTMKEWPGSVTPAEQEPLNVSALGGLAQVQVGSISLPLLKDDVNDSGLLALGNLGAIESYSQTGSPAEALASSGLLGDDGALNLDEYNDGSYETGVLDVSELIEQLLGQTVRDEVLDQASIDLGALGSTAEKSGGVVDSDYVFTDLELNLHSNLVDGLMDEVTGVVETAVAPIDALVGENGAVYNLVNGVVQALDALSVPVVGGINANLNDLSIDTTPLTDEVQSQLLAAPLENSDGSVSIDLSNGAIHVDLAALVIDSTGATDLNSLPANTEVLSGDVVNAILDGVTDALIGNGNNSLVTKVVNIVTAGVYDIELNVDIQVEVEALGAFLPPLVNAPVFVTGDIGGFLGQTGHDDPVVDISQISVAGIPAGAVLQPITDALTGLVSNIGGALEPVVDGVIANVQPMLMDLVGPLVTELLDDALEPLLSEVAAITVNEQPTPSDFGNDGFTVRALNVTLLPNVTQNGAVSLQLASSTVQALDEEPAPPAEDVAITAPDDGAELMLECDSDGISVAFEGTGEPGADITIERTDSGSPVEIGTTTVDGDGNWSETVSFGPGGPYDITVTQDADGDESTATTSFEVVENPDCEGDPDSETDADVNVDGTEDSDADSDVDADANVNASASASASANADADSNPAAEAAAQAAADADANSTASAAADANAEAAAAAAADEDASSDASTDATTEANASASAAAQASADSDADSAQDANSSAAANANASAAAQAAAEADASTNASQNAAADADDDADADVNVDGAEDSDADADVNAHASASASASANADDESNASAQAAAQAAAIADAETSASAASDADATAAAQSAATADASSEASANADADENAAAQSAAETSANADASSQADANQSSAADANAAAAAQAAANSDASTNASQDAAADASGDPDSEADADVNVDGTNTDDADSDSDSNANVNASASAAASANADDDSNAAAEAAAQAAATADANSTASAAADANAEAAAAAAADEEASADASADVSSEANASAQAAAQASADSDADSAQDANASAATDANAASAAQAAAEADASTDASQNAAADADGDPEGDTATSGEASTSADSATSGETSASADSNASGSTPASADAAAQGSGGDGALSHTGGSVPTWFIVGILLTLGAGAALLTANATRKHARASRVK